MRGILDKDATAAGGWASEVDMLRTLLMGDYILGLWDEIEESADRHGVHFIKYKRKGRREALALRQLLGDDPARVEFDERQSVKPFSILWTRKKNGKSEIAPTSRNNLLALPWKSLVPRCVYAPKSRR